MQNVGQSENRNIDKVNVQLDVVKSSTPHSSASSPAKSETETFSGAPARYMTDSSESEDDSVSEAEMDEEGGGAEPSKFLLTHEDADRAVDPEMQARLEALLEAAGIGKLSGEGKHLADPEVLRRLTSSVSCALDEAAAALTRMRSDQPPPHHRHHHQDKNQQCGSSATGTTSVVPAPDGADGAPSLAEACSDGDVGTVRKLLTEGRSVHETTEEGESLLSLACSAGYYELAQVLLAMHASVEDRGIKGDCTPLMEAASAGHVDIVRLLVAHGADVNAVSGSGNTPLMYACAGGHDECVRALLANGANVEDHNENGHTPLMEAASAGHVEVAKILLDNGAGINTHSNEFKESALTLACYKGHLDMVRFLLDAGADREHKTDEMHTALMEASMDGHVEVARLLLDSGAQVNMPTDSFESPLTLAACGGHVELAMLLIERGANIEEVNDEGYTPLMEASREGHEEMVALLVGQNAIINSQTDETQETALTLACCGGFLEVADFLLKAGADLELGASTPLMEASQEGHIELVRFLLNAGAMVNAQTQTGDTALTYACENGHTDVADMLLRAGAALEHESEGGRTPLMKACRAGHVCTVQFLIGKGADVNRMTALGDHTPLSLACAGGHVDVVKFLLACEADPFRKLKDNSTMLIEAAKGGHTAVVQLLLDFPHSVMLPRGNVPAEDSSGLSAAQAAALGLSHAAAPGSAATAPPAPGASPAPAPARALLPAHAHPHTALHHPPHHHPADLPSKFSKVYLDERGVAGRKKTAGAGGAGAAGAGVASAGPCGAGVGAAEGAKHKCARKQRPAPPHSDHHLPPPPDILDDTRDPRVDCLPEADRSLLDLPDPAGPPTLATSALHALDLQFCAQGVTTVHQSPTTPPYPPPSQLFPVQQLPTNINQHQLQELQQAQYQQLAVQQQQAHQQQHKKQQHQQEQYVPELQRPEVYPMQGVEDDSAGGGVEAGEVGAVLAYLQREVPALVALPPHELRSLVLQVMQQKSHSLAESEVRRATREALSAAWPRGDPDLLHYYHHPHHLPEFGDVMSEAGGSACQLRLAAGACGVTLPRAEDEPAAELQPHFALPPPTLPYDDYRSATFAPPHTGPASTTLPPAGTTLPPAGTTLPPGPLGVGVGVGAPTGPPAPTPAPAPAPHPKREHYSTAATTRPKKVKARFSGSGRGCRSSEAGGAAGAGGATNAAAPAPAAYCAMDVDGETDSNHDTALTLACAGGHEDLVELLLLRGADIEHRDKKGFTPLILAATAGHEKIVEILLNHGADIEAQSERTKDTPLSLACSGGRYEVVELILNRGANKEHRNVSDYTPLSLAASGGYVNIIRLLLTHQAEINSRTGSKLGISPLMLAAMNGHTSAVKLLLDCGSDINAQIETNRNTALTLACFQGRHEVVSLLLDRKANVEHRAKTGLTPLMEAASGGYVDVGRVLLDKGADVNAPPVPSSRDTALTIAADKGHTKFVELLLQRRAAVEVKNKKGNSPLWLAANGGHLAVVEMLYAAGADIDSQDNRKVSCLMAAFRKGHTKVVKWMVGVVSQFPSDQEMTRYVCTLSDKEMLEKCQECVRCIRAAKETQAARANQNATILLEELDAERNREELRRLAAARRRERKKKKKHEKKEERRKLQAENDKNSIYSEKALGECSEGGEPDDEPVAKEEGDSGIDANSQGSCSSSDVKAPPVLNTKAKKKKKEDKAPPSPPAPAVKKQPDKNKAAKIEAKPEKETSPKTDKKQEKENVAPSSPPATPAKPSPAADRRTADKRDKKPEEEITKSITVQNVNKYGNNSRKSQIFEATRLNVDKDDVDTSDKNKKTQHMHQWEVDSSKSTSPKGGCVGGRREEGWKEVVRKSSVQTLSTVEPGCKKVSVASHAISRVIGRAGSNINAIRSATGAHIEVDKQSKGQGERIITIKGSAEATRQAAMLIAAMIRDPDADIVQLLPRAAVKPAPTPLPLQPKTPKQPPPKSAAGVSGNSSSSASNRATPTARAVPKTHVAAARPAPPRLQPHSSSSDKRVAVSSAPSVSASSTPPSCKTTGGLTYTGVIVGARPHTFAAKLTAGPLGMPASAPAPAAASADTTPRPRPTHQQTTAGGASPGGAAALSPQRTRDQSPPPATAPAPPVAPLPLKTDDSEAKAHRLPERTMQLSPDNSSSWSANEDNAANTSTALHINTTPQAGASSGGTQEYSLFKDLSAGAGAVWGAAGDSHHSVEPPPQQAVVCADASKAPGYRGAGGGAGGGCSPSSRTSSHGSTPPPAYPPAASTHHAQQPYHQPMPIGNNVNAMDMAGLSRNGPIYQDNSRNGHNMMQQVSLANAGVGVNMGLGYVGVENVSRLNPRAPDFAQRHPLMQQKHNAQLFAGASNAGNLSALLMSYQQQQPMAPSPKPMPQAHPHYQSLLERGVGGVAGGWGEEEERKPRPIGTERAWKMIGGDDWAHAHHPHHAHIPDHDRYQGVNAIGGHGHVGPGLEYGVAGGASGAGATAAALSLMQHALPLHYLPPGGAAPAPDHLPHWDQQHHAPDKQAWSKWTH